MNKIQKILKLATIFEKKTKINTTEDVFIAASQEINDIRDDNLTYKTFKDRYFKEVHPYLNVLSNFYSMTAKYPQIRIKEIRKILSNIKTALASINAHYNVGNVLYEYFPQYNELNKSINSVSGLDDTKILEYAVGLEEQEQKPKQSKYLVDPLVKELQQELNKHLKTNKLEQDSAFGPATQNALHQVTNLPITINVLDKNKIKDNLQNYIQAVKDINIDTKELNKEQEGRLEATQETPWL